MKTKEQLEKWVKGTSLHNLETGECCPDFSCCVPDLLVPESDRRLFYKAYRTGNNATKVKLLFYFLDRALKHMKENDNKVYITGEDQEVIIS